MKSIAQIIIFMIGEAAILLFAVYGVMLFGFFPFVAMLFFGDNRPPQYVQTGLFIFLFFIIVAFIGWLSVLWLRLCKKLIK